MGKGKCVEGACSEAEFGKGYDDIHCDGLTDPPNRRAETKQRVNRRKTADGREMPKAVSRGKCLVMVKEKGDLPEPEVQVL